MSKVELQSKTSKARRNSWAEIYNETTALRKHKMLLGQEVETDDGLEWRVKWGQRGVGLFGVAAVVSHFAQETIALIVFAAAVFTFLGTVYYKNVSLAIAKRLLRETNVVIIILLALCNLCIDLQDNVKMATMGFIYLVMVNIYIFLDTVKIKSRMFVIVVGVLFALIHVFNVYNLIFGDWDQGVVLLKYAIQGNEYTFMKRSTRRSIYIQIMLFSMNGIYTLFKDRKQELMIFATGNIYRETGTASREVEQKSFVRKIKSEKKSLSKKVELGVMRISGSPAEVELKERKMSKASRNSWTDIYNETTALHKHKKLLGQDAEIDDGLEWRVKWGQRGNGLCAFIAIFAYFVDGTVAQTITISFGVVAILFWMLFFFKNTSLVIIKRLVKEVNVVVIFMLTVCNAIIDIIQPGTAFSPILGIIYMVVINAFVFADAIKVKSRIYVIVIGILFVLLNINNIYGLIFGDLHQGVVLLKYTIQGNEYTFMKRSVKRSIYIQVMLFSITGIYTLVKDRKQELLIFATGHIYRETGTASKELEDKLYSENIELENVV